MLYAENWDSLGEAGRNMFIKAQNRLPRAVSVLLENLWASAVQFSSIYLRTRINWAAKADFSWGKGWQYTLSRWPLRDIASHSAHFKVGAVYSNFSNSTIMNKNKKTPEGVYAGCVGVSKNYVEWHWKVSSVSTTNVCRRDGRRCSVKYTRKWVHKGSFAPQNKTYINITTIYDKEYGLVH